MQRNCAHGRFSSHLWSGFLRNTRSGVCLVFDAARKSTMRRDSLQKRSAICNKTRLAVDFAGSRCCGQPGLTLSLWFACSMLRTTWRNACLEVHVLNVAGNPVNRNSISELAAEMRCYGLPVSPQHHGICCRNIAGRDRRGRAQLGI